MNVKLITGGVALLAAATGSVAGYLTAQKRLKRQFEERVAQEVSEARDFYAMKYKDGDFATPASTLKIMSKLPDRTPGAELTDLDRQIAEEGRGEPMAAVQGVGRRPVTIGDLERMAEGLGYQAGDQTLPTRPDPKHIRVITEEVYNKNESGYQQVTWTYYAADGIITDAADKVIENHENQIGYRWLDEFGEDTSDADTVHVQNTKLGLEIEIVRSQGSYQFEVLGQG